MRFRPEDQRRDGKVAALVALCFTVLLGVVAVALDGGILLTERRHAQATADAAALAAATDLFKNYGTNQGLDPSNTARNSALAVAAANGYNNDGTTSVVTVNFNPNMSGQTLAAHRNPGYVEVIVQYNQPPGFSVLFGATNVPIQARAVARGAYKIPRGGVIALDPTAGGAITANGGGAVTVMGGEVIINSSDTSTNGALTVTGGGTITATSIDIMGSYSAPEGSLSVVPTTGVPPTPDPLRILPEPTRPPEAPRVSQQTIPKTDPVVDDLLTRGIITQTQLDGFNTVYLLEPGTYTSNNNLRFQQTDLVIFRQASYDSDGGIYYLEGGIQSTGASMIMDPSTSGGIMFFNAGTGVNDAIVITGSPDGIVNLKGLASGIYMGLLIFQSRSSTQSVRITGNGDFSMLGGFYAASATLDIVGNGGSSIIGSMYVSDQLRLSGNGNIGVAYNSGFVPFQRILGLVE